VFQNKKPHAQAAVKIITAALVSSILLALPGLSASAASPKQGAPCSRAGQKQAIGNLVFTCTKSGKKLVWGKAVSLAKPVAAPIASGEPNPASQSAKVDYSFCQLKDTRADKSNPSNASSFSVSPNKVLATTGILNIAVLPLDFSDYPGSGNPSDLTAQAIQQADQWVELQSKGKLKFNWLTSKTWLRLEKTSKYYNFDEHKNPSTYAQTEQAMAQQYMNAADKAFDLSKVDVAILLFPPTTDALPLGGYSHGYKLSSSHGTISPVYFGGEFNFPTKPGMADIWMHEMAHFQGIAGHAPANGSPLHIMANQFGQARIMDAWDSAIAGWLDQTNVACFDSSKLGTSPVSVALSSIDGSRTGIVSAFVRLSASKVVVIESRKPGPFSKLETQGQGVVAYVVDTSVTSQRCDSCEPSLELDKKQFAYYLRIDNGTRGGWQVPMAPSFNLNQIAYEGESFTEGDVHIKFKKSGAQDAIELSRY
jgi:hypothetical protein